MTNESTTQSVGRTHVRSGTRVASIAFAVVLLGVETVVVAESWRGLVGFAHVIGITGVAADGVPPTLDGVSLVAALVALRAELSGESSGLYRLTLYLFTAASAAANWWHGYRVGGAEAAEYLGGMSIAVALTFSLALRQLRLEDRRQAGRVTERLPRFSGAHWLRFPGLTFRAWSLAVRDGHSTARAALAAALASEPLPVVPAAAELAELPKAEAIRIALAHCEGRVLAAQEWLADRGITVDRAYAHDVKRGVSGRRRSNRAEPVALERFLANGSVPDLTAAEHRNGVSS